MCLDRQKAIVSTVLTIVSTDIEIVEMVGPVSDNGKLASSFRNSNLVDCQVKAVKRLKWKGGKMGAG